MFLPVWVHNFSNHSFLDLQATTVPDVSIYVSNSKQTGLNSSWWLLAPLKCWLFGRCDFLWSLFVLFEWLRLIRPADCRKTLLYGNKFSDSSATSVIFGALTVMKFFFVGFFRILIWKNRHFCFCMSFIFFM